jgi:hypothetical protein
MPRTVVIGCLHDALGPSGPPITRPTKPWYLGRWVDKAMNWEVNDELSQKLRKIAETAQRRLSTDIHAAVWAGDAMLVQEFIKVSNHT